MHRITERQRDCRHDCYESECRAQPQGGRRTNVSILSNRFDLREALEGEFDVATFSFRRLDEIRQQPADVVLVDARSEHYHELVADLSRRSQRQVVVIGPPDESAQAMRYLDLGASDFFSSRTAPSARRGCGPRRVGRKTWSATMTSTW